VTDAAKPFGRTVVASPERRREADVDWEVVRRVQAGEFAAFDALVVLGALVHHALHLGECRLDHRIGMQRR